MNDQPEAGAAKRPQGKNRTPKNRTQRRRGLQRLFYYVSSIATSVICGFLLGHGWSRQPVIPARHATVPAAPAAMPLTPPQVSATDTASGADVPPDASQPPVVESRPLPPPPQASGKEEEEKEPVETIPPLAAPQPQPPSDSAYFVQVAAFS